MCITKHFPVSAAEISAPRVELTSRKGQTEVDITDPPMKKRNLRDVYTYVSYLILYWKKGEAKKVMNAMVFEVFVAPAIHHSLVQFTFYICFFQVIVNVI